MKNRLIDSLLALALWSCAPTPPIQVNYDEISKKGDVFLYQGKPFTGVTFANYPNGKRKMEIALRDGVYNGSTREWSEDGVLEAETMFADGLRDGPNRYWFPDGTLMKDQIYANGKLVSSRHFNHGKPVPGE